MISLSQLVTHLRGRGETVALELCHGPFELGGLVIHRGALWHAEAPGASGDAAWLLLKDLPAMTAHLKSPVPELPRRSVTKEEPAGTRLDVATSTAIESARAARVVQLGEAHAAAPPTANLSQITVPPAPIPAGPADSVTQLDEVGQQTYEELFRAGTQAYLRHDFKRALEAFGACQRLRPNDKRVLHNLERLKTRLRPGESS